MTPVFRFVYTHGEENVIAYIYLYIYTVLRSTETSEEVKMGNSSTWKTTCEQVFGRLRSTRVFSFFECRTFFRLRPWCLCLPSARMTQETNWRQVKGESGLLKEAKWIHLFSRLLPAVTGLLKLLQSNLKWKKTFKAFRGSQASFWFVCFSYNCLPDDRYCLSFKY